MLEKTYDSSAVEPKIVTRWAEADAFAAGAGAQKQARIPMRS
jgi:valyl-tRNA synthetase